MKTVTDYVLTRTPMIFHKVLEVTHQKGEMAFTCRLPRYVPDANNAFGAVVSPYKSWKICFSEKDCLFVLAES